MSYDREYDPSVDFNTSIENFSRHCADRSAHHRAEIKSMKELAADPARNGGMGLDERQVRKHELEAQRWDARRQEADNGFLMVDHNDISFGMGYSTLIQQAYRAGRVTDATPSGL
jgi:hypothetical protein